MNNSKRDLLNSHEKDEIEYWLTRYPKDQRQSALLGALRAVMHEDKYLSRDKMDAVADYIGIPAIAVYEVASFYSMFELEPVGQHTIAVCDNVSCLLRGADNIVSHVEKRLGIKRGESTSDGLFFFKMEEECLAACCNAPMMQLDHVYHEDLTTQKVDTLLDQIIANHSDKQE